ncbi:MAG: glycosyltransferase family 2 protein [Bacteroidetes bacterium]|nr:glycosyltransferase family 2 protein [Bacteroidota bacterium]
MMPSPDLLSKPISIISIHFNHCEGLKRTAESILAQTKRSLVEWVVIDGGSSDGSVEFLQGLGKSIEHLVIEPDKGIYDAMNKGLNLCSGEYVWFMNAGDIIHGHDVVEKIMDGIDTYVKQGKARPDVIFGDTQFVNQDGSRGGLISQCKPQPFPHTLDGNSFRFGMNICHQSFLAKRFLCDAFDLQYKQASDIDWIIRILKKMQGESCRVNFVISDFELGGSSTEHTRKAWKERYLVLQRQYGVLPNFLAHGWILIRRLLFYGHLLGKKQYIF